MNTLTGTNVRLFASARSWIEAEAVRHIEAVIQDLVDAGLLSVIAALRPLLTCKTRRVRR